MNLKKFIISKGLYEEYLLERKKYMKQYMKNYLEKNRDKYPNNYWFVPKKKPFDKDLLIAYYNDWMKHSWIAKKMDITVCRVQYAIFKYKKDKLQNERNKNMG